VRTTAAEKIFLVHPEFSMNLEKRKIPVAKTEKSDNCEAPRVVYRTKITAGPAGEDNPQP
jgi:hypothetical protein